MRHFSRTLLLRVLAGLLIGIGMFYFKSAHAQTTPLVCPSGQLKVYRFASQQFTDGRLGSAAPNCVAGSNQSNTVEGVIAACQEVGQENGLASFGITLTWEASGTASYSNGAWRAYQRAAGPGSRGVENRVSEHCIPAPECPEDKQGFWTVSEEVENPERQCKGQCLYRKTKERAVTVPGLTPLYKAHYTADPPARCEANAEQPDPTQTFSTPGPSDTPIGTHEPQGTPVEQTQHNCGLINGEAVCLDSPTQDGQCTTLQSGAGFCVQSPTETDDPPRTPPNNEPDTPLGTLTETIYNTTNNTTTTVVTNFYSQQQFNNSTNYGDNPDPDPDPDPDCDPATDPTCEPDGGGGDGEGTGRFKGPGGTAKTFGQSASDFSGRIGQAPVVAGLAGLGDAIPTGGDCPTASFQALGQSFTIDAHCPLLDQYKALISGVFLLGWALFSILLFFKA